MPQPPDVIGRVIAACGFPFCICSARHVYDMNERIRVSEVVEELVAETFALVCTGYETGYVEKFNWDATLAIYASTVIRFTAIL